jgi:RNA polymerase sigma-70 factor (ECF subfamily)
MTDVAAPTQTTDGAGPLDPEVVAPIDAWWRAANYVSVRQIYLLVNPVLREPLAAEHIESRLLGHQLLETRKQGVEPTTGPVGMAADGLDQAASVFVGAQPRLFKIAYRVLGSVGEAEDVVQEAWLRWQGTDRTVVLDPSAFLTTTTTRLAINVAQSARRRHEAHFGSWLPEPVDSSFGPESRAERREAVEMAILQLMEKLTPTERAAYLLREAFAYPYGKISDVLHLGVANTRQLVRRARQHLATERRAPVNSAAHRHLVRAFLAAAQAGNLAGLEGLLATEAAHRTHEVGSGKTHRPARTSSPTLESETPWI